MTTTIIRTRERALLHEHIVALCAIIVAIMARQLSVLALVLSPKSMAKSSLYACILLTFWASAINNTHLQQQRLKERQRERERERGKRANQQCQKQSTARSSLWSFWLRAQSLTCDKNNHPLASSPTPSIQSTHR